MSFLLQLISIKNFFSFNKKLYIDETLNFYVLKNDFFLSQKTIQTTYIYAYEWNASNSMLFLLKQKIFVRFSYVFKRVYKNKLNAKTFLSIKEKSSLIKSINLGFLFFWNALKIWVFSLIVFTSAFYMLLLKRIAILPQTLFFWIGLTMLLYWLLSGFVFFVKKYQFSRYTSVIQRFWRRTYILFWLIESGLLLVFFYLVFNSSQESFYMFDQGYFLKSHLFSWRIFIFKCILVVTLITYSYLVLLNLKWNTFNKNILNLIILSSLLLYFVWMEFYQIYWVSNFYANFFWVYDFEESIWSLEWDSRRTRILNHYVMILFLLKFWHIVFIFACWVFFLLRSNELNTITYPLYSFNFQNFLILFIMMWLFMYPWFKHTFHWLSQIPYYWFYVDIHNNFIKLIVYDLTIFLNCFLKNFTLNHDVFYFLKQSDFINWGLFDRFTDLNAFIKHTLKENVLFNLI